MSHLVNGYAGQPDSAKLVNAFHAAVIALRLQWWGEWIPSKANIADIMTRIDRIKELYDGLGADTHVKKWPFELPPMGNSTTRLRDWARLMRQRADACVL